MWRNLSSELYSSYETKYICVHEYDPLSNESSLNGEEKKDSEIQHDWFKSARKI